MSEAVASLCENATGPSRILDVAIVRALYPEIGPYNPHCQGEEPIFWNDPYRKRPCPELTASVDAALALLPAGACNIDLFSFGGGGRDDLPKGATCWGFKFHDQDQLVGIDRAKAEVKRLKKDSGALFKVAGAPKMVLERAIAEQFMEFSSSHTANAALAICAAALRARSGDPVGGSR